MTPLHSFLNEVRALPKARKALAEGAIVNGTPAADLFEEVAVFFDGLRTRDDPLIVKLHDEAERIVSRRDLSLRERFFALFDLLKAHAPERSMQ